MVYDLRVYRITPGSMPKILHRFENHTFGFFKKHGIEVVGFWTHDIANEIVYICKFRDQAAMEKAWAAFPSDPEWIKLRQETEADGELVWELTSHMLNPTSFSPLQ